VLPRVTVVCTHTTSHSRVHTECFHVLQSCAYRVLPHVSHSRVLSHDKSQSCAHRMLARVSIVCVRSVATCYSRVHLQTNCYRYKHSSLLFFARFRCWPRRQTLWQCSSLLACLYTRYVRMCLWCVRVCVCCDVERRVSVRVCVVMLSIG